MFVSTRKHAVFTGVFVFLNWRIEAAVFPKTGAYNGRLCESAGLNTTIYSRRGGMQEVNNAFRSRAFPSAASLPLQSPHIKCTDRADPFRKNVPSMRPLRMQRTDATRHTSASQRQCASCAMHPIHPTKNGGARRAPVLRKQAATNPRFDCWRADAGGSTLRRFDFSGAQRRSTDTTRASSHNDVRVDLAASTLSRVSA